MGIQFSALQGIIRRRILLNYAADADVVQKILPSPFRPKLHDGWAVTGVCLIRLEKIRPKLIPIPFGITSENAAHRIAVEWVDDNGNTREGVYIPRRDTGSALNAWAGGRVFPGEHHRAEFAVSDDGSTIDFHMRSRDNLANVKLNGRTAASLPDASIFSSMAEASQFFERGCDGFSPGLTSDNLQGLQLCIDDWRADPLEIYEAECNWYQDESRFPKGSIRLDHALIMRDVPHSWRSVGRPQGE